MKKSSILLSLILTFMKIGLFTFGGGYAMIPIIESECVEKRKWLTHDELINVTIIAESTPGPIAINCATYVGYRQAGLWGSVFSTFGVVLPSFVIIYLISLFFENILEITIIANAFKGIKIAVGILIINVAVKMLKKMSRKKLSMAILLCSLAVMLIILFFKWNISSIYIILIAGLTGLLALLLKQAKTKDRSADK